MMYDLGTEVTLRFHFTFKNAYGSSSVRQLQQQQGAIMMWNNSLHLLQRAKFQFMKNYSCMKYVCSLKRSFCEFERHFRSIH
jgi:hypothetical protein